LWGKMDDKQGSWHTLLWHLIDAGMVAKALWKEQLSESFRKDMEECFGLSADDMMNLIAYWVALHDIGKAGPAFQRKSEKHQAILKKEGVSFPPVLSPVEGYHGLATTWVVREYFQNQYAGQARSTNRMAIAIGGHHGEFPLNKDINSAVYRKDHLGDETWQELRAELIRQLEQIFCPPRTVNFPTERSRLNSACLLIAALTTTADWIASNEAYFPYQTDEIGVQSYVAALEKRIPAVMQALGWRQWEPEGKRFSFEELFPGLQPNPLQSRFIQATEKIQSPFMVILEAPTGSGKTEAALYLTDTHLQLEGKGGFYIAMPTQATSNQMFERTVNYLLRRYPQNLLNVQLVHGAALLNEFFENLRFQAINQDDPNPYAQTSSEDWFQPRKRTLLAPFGVGTVDQTFLAVMRCRHFFMRLFGLSHKVVIFDEVHAYDVYMLEIFKRVLSWLRMVQTSVIILSATLPQSSKLELVEAYCGKPLELHPKKYPRITVCSAGEAHTIPLGEAEKRRIRVDWIEDHEIEDYLQKQLCAGGNAALIGNRVKRTQQLYERIQPLYGADSVSLFHSRFPACWRAEIEKSVTDRYGKNVALRPQKSVLIATQVVEQSLDLDFDVMISDLAPIDLLIQRIGRLHRHGGRKEAPRRPARLTEPAIALVKPAVDERGLPLFGDDRFVYARYILARTYFALRDVLTLNLPEETDRFIEEVYAETYSEHIPVELWAEISQYLEELTGRNLRDELKASSQLIGGCQEDLLGSLSTSFADEHDPLSQNIIRAVTRNARPSVELVCLIKTDGAICTLHDHHPIDLEKEADKETVKACLFSTVGVAKNSVVKYFLAQKPPAAWKKNASLRTRYPLIFENNTCELPHHILMIDRQRGLEVLDKP